MKRRHTLFGALASLLVLAGTAQAQFAPTGTTSVSVAVAAEAALSVTSTTSLTNTGTIFNDYTGSTAFTYKIRTGSSTTYNIGLQVTQDFNPAGGPSIATPPTSGDALTYQNTVSTPGTGVSGTQTASTANKTGVATFGAGANSAKAGNSGSVAWNLTDDPQYSAGSYSATITFTISAT